MIRLTPNNIKKALIGRTLMVSDNLTKEMVKVEIKTVDKVNDWYSINKLPDGGDEACLIPSQIKSLLNVGYTLDNIHTFYLLRE